MISLRKVLKIYRWNDAQGIPYEVRAYSKKKALAKFHLWLGNDLVKLKDIY